MNSAAQQNFPEFVAEVTQLGAVAVEGFGTLAEIGPQPVVKEEEIQIEGPIVQDVTRLRHAS